jgi:hypothetical protein
MNRPAYFIITHMDLTGSSTSWHRAELIRSTFAHFNEWWLIGTDYTRHWMASGVADPNHADITNHYIANGVVGGLLLMVLFIWLFVKAFSLVGKAIKSETTENKPFYAWVVGASLFAHAVTCLSVSYFDASIIFLYFTLAATPALVTANAVVSAVLPARELAPGRSAIPAQTARVPLRLRSGAAASSSRALKWHRG